MNEIECEYVLRVIILLCAHMLMVTIYVECIYVVVGDDICNVHICTLHI